MVQGRLGQHHHPCLAQHQVPGRDRHRRDAAVYPHTGVPQRRPAHGLHHVRLVGVLLWPEPPADVPPVASEASYTIMPNMGYFEFLPIDEESGVVSGDTTHPVDLTRVEAGREYELVITTYAGLNRHRVGDISSITGFRKTTPRLLSIESNKTDESELQHAVDRASALLRPHDVSVVKYTSHASTKSTLGHYVIYAAPHSAPLRLRLRLRLTLHAAPLPPRPRANGARPSRPPRLPRGRAAPARPIPPTGTRPASAGARPGPPPHSRTARRRRLGLRARHLLRRRRRLRHHGRGVRLRQPLQHGLRLQHGGAEHGALQQRPQLRRLLRGPLRPGRHRGRRAARLPARLHRRYRHQLLPAQLRAGLRRRRLVQPAPRTLRHGTARLPAHRALQGRYCSSFLPQGGVPEEGRHPVHHQRPLLLQPRPRHQRRRPRRRARGGRQVRPLGGVAGALPQLGPELAEQRAARRPAPLLPRHRRRRPLRRLQQPRAPRMVLRPDLQRCPVLKRASGVVLSSSSSK